MSGEPDLEARLAESNPQTATSPTSLSGKIAHHSKYFVVDGMSSALVSPIMAITEVVSGMEWNEIGKSRGLGAMAAFFTGYAYNSLLRGRLARGVGVDTESSWLRRKSIDTTIGAVTMVPYYAPMLYFAGASSKEMAIALFLGSLVGAAVGGVYGSIADRWRVYCGLKPVLNK